MNITQTLFRKSVLALVCITVLTLFGCSENQSDFSNTNPELGFADEFDVESRANLLSNRHSARFLNQATFGSSRDAVLEIRTLGREAWLDKQFAMSVGKTHLERIVGSPYPMNNFDKDLGFGNTFGSEHIVNKTWESYITADDQLRKRIGAALLQTFVINARVSDIGIRPNQLTAASFLDMLEKHAFGNFRDLLYDTSRHTAMSHYLSFYQNEKATYDENGLELTVPDENYAREILQLFSIGLYELNINGKLKLDQNSKPIETYTQDDIFNLARVFTGWQYSPRGSYTKEEYIVQRMHQPLVVNADNHSPEEKSFLGTTIPANTDAYTSLDITIDTIFNHPNVGPFISKQLIQRLVTSNPSRAYIARVSKVFNSNENGQRGDMKSVIRAILLDTEAKNPNPVKVRGKLREPMIRLTAVARALSYKQSATNTTYPIASLTDTSHGLGQSPFKSPSVFNFFRPGYTPPNSDIASEGYVAPEFQIVTGSAIPGSINLINEFIERGDDVFSADWSYLLNRAKKPKNIVNYLNILLTGKSLTDAEIAVTESVVETMPADTRDQRIERVKAALQIIAASPSFLIQN